MMAEDYIARSMAMDAAEAAEKGGSGGKDYNILENKPSINGVVLQGDLSLEDLGITDGNEVHF